MFKRLINNIKEYIVSEYKFLIILFSTLIICTWPVNYYVILGGGIGDIDKKITVTDESKSSGSYNYSYVSEINGNLALYLLSYVIPSWELDNPGDYKYVDSETMEDINFRGVLDLKASNGYAIKWAYTLADKDINLKSSKLYVISVDEKSNNGFKIGDQIIEINDHKISSYDDCEKYFANNEGDNYKIKIIRNKKEKILDCKTYDSNGKKILGIYIQAVEEYNVKPEADVDFSKNESGPSAGLITTLAIYDKLVDEDLTHGLKIAGTGTIEADGKIGQIGGVKYKIMGAAKKKADIFLVPKGDNYKEAMKVKKDKKLKIKIVGVSTINEAITVLEKL